MHTAAAGIALSVQSQHDTQKRNEWGKRLGDIVGLKMLADYQSAVQVQASMTRYHLLIAYTVTCQSLCDSFMISLCGKNAITEESRLCTPASWHVGRQCTCMSTAVLVMHVGCEEALLLNAMTPLKLSLWAEF